MPVYYNEHQRGDVPTEGEDRTIVLRFVVVEDDTIHTNFDVLMNNCESLNASEVLRYLLPDASRLFPRGIFVLFSGPN